MIQEFGSYADLCSPILSSFPSYLPPQAIVLLIPNAVCEAILCTAELKKPNKPKLQHDELYSTRPIPFSLYRSMASWTVGSAQAREAWCLQHWAGRRDTWLRSDTSVQHCFWAPGSPSRGQGLASVLRMPQPLVGRCLRGDIWFLHQPWAGGLLTVLCAAMGPAEFPMSSTALLRGLNSMYKSRGFAARRRYILNFLLHGLKREWFDNSESSEHIWMFFCAFTILHWPRTCYL